MGGLLPKPVTEKVSEAGSSERMEWSAVSMQGWRPSMEDSHIAIANVGDEFSGIGLYCVFDGHGGKAVANFVKTRFEPEMRLITQEVGKKKFGKNKHKKRHCGAKLESEDFPEILKNSFHRMDDMLRDPANAKTLSHLVGRVPGGAIADLRKSLQAAQKKHESGMMSREEQEEMAENYIQLQKFEQAEKGEAFTADNVGCTAICVLVRQTDIIAANAGDSRSVLCRGGEAVELSFDHKPASEIEEKRIVAAGGRLEMTASGARVNGSLNLSRSLGDLEYKKRDDLPPEEQVICATPDFVIKELTPEDEFVVLACDGIWDVLTNQQVCDFIRPKMLEKMDLRQIGEELVDRCLSQDPKETNGLGTDNMTVVIVKLCECDVWK